MKWIGQHIYNYVSKFRNAATFEAHSNSLGNDPDRYTTIIGDNIEVTNSSTSNGPYLLIQSTFDHQHGPYIDYANLRANPADFDRILQTRYYAKNDNDETYLVGQEFWKFADVSDGAEKGEYSLSIASHTSAGNYNFFKGVATGANEIDVDIALGTSSTTNIRGGLIVHGGAFNFDSVGITAIQTSAESFVDNDTSLMTSAAILDKITSATVGSGVDLTSEVSGILPVANGGTGASSLTDNKLLTGTGTSAVTAEANATYDGADLSLTSATSTKPILSIENTTNDANAGELKLIGRRSADASIIAAAGDDAGTISFVGENAKTGPDPETITYSKIVGESAVVTDEAEMGKVSMSVVQNWSASGGALGYVNVLNSTASLLGESTTYGAGMPISTATFDTTVSTFQSAVTTGPMVSVRNNTNDATGGALNFVNSRGGAGSGTANQNGDDLGSILWNGFDSGAVATTFAKILGEANEVTNGSEEGKLTLSVASHDAELQPGLMMVSGNAEDEVDVTIGNEASSVTTIAGTLTMGSTAAMTNVGQLSVAAQPNITTMTGFLGGTANALITDDGDGTITSEANATYDGNDLTLTSSTSDKPVLSLTNTNTTSSSSAILKFIKDAADVAVGEYLGQIDFIGDNDAGTPEQITYAKIWSRVLDKTDGGEEGTLYLGVASHDGEMNQGLELRSGDVEDEVDVSIGYRPASTTTIKGNLDVITEATIPSRKFTVTGTTHFEYQGDVLYFGGGSTTQGDLCFLSELGTWQQADADGAATGDDADRDATGMLAIALGTDPDVDGMFIRGVITMDSDMGDVGNPLYIKTTAGGMSQVAPSSSGDFVRVVGYCLDDTNGQIYFNPDNTWVEIA